jgi:hypothetical protein
VQWFCSKSEGDVCNQRTTAKKTMRYMLLATACFCFVAAAMPAWAADEACQASCHGYLAECVKGCDDAYAPGNTENNQCRQQCDGNYGQSCLTHCPLH